MYQPPPKEAFQSFLQFVNDGGRLIVMNSASPILGFLLPGRIVPGRPSTTVNAAIRVGKDKDLFSGYESFEMLDLEYYRQPIEVIDKKDAKVLAKIRSWRDEALMARLTLGAGVIYIMVSKMFTADKKIDNDKLQKYLKDKGAGTQTLAAWECVQKVGYKEPLQLALQVYPSIEILGRLIVKEALQIQALRQQNEETLNQERMLEEQTSLEERGRESSKAMQED